MAPHSSTRAWQILWTEEPGLQSMGSLGVRTRLHFPFHFSLSCIGEGNGNPLQCSCLENPRDGGAWWAAANGVDKSRTRLSDFHFSLSCVGEGNGTPLQCSCLESPRDGGAWWAAVYGVAQGRTRLKRLSSSGSSSRAVWELSSSRESKNDSVSNLPVRPSITVRSTAWACKMF